MSPWVDANLLYVRTGGLDRLGFATAVGIAVPIDDRRRFWIGPYARYFQILQGERVGIDNRDAKVLDVGISLEVLERGLAQGRIVGLHGLQRDAQRLRGQCEAEHGEHVLERAAGVRNHRLVALAAVVRRRDELIIRGPLVPPCDRVDDQLTPHGFEHGFAGHRCEPPGDREARQDRAATIAYLE